jgi:hypothetical protein
MNERIKELAKEAGITTNLDTDYFVNDPDSSLKTLSNAGKWVDYFSEKFAELFVRECVHSIEKTIETKCDTDSEKMGCEFAITDLLEHFGVEESKGWVCPKCGTDRGKAVCPKGLSAAVTGDCPMHGVAQ